MAALLNAPPSDEPETDEERAAVAAAKASLRAGEPTSTLEELADEWGLANGACDSRWTLPVANL